MSGTDESLLLAHLFPSIPPSLRPSAPLAKSFLSSVNKILSDPTSPMSNVAFYRIMKDSATPQPPIYTAHANAINKMDARGAEVVILCALMAKYPAALSLSGQEQGLKIVKYWLKEASFIDGGGSIEVLIFILRSVRDLKVTGELVSVWRRWGGDVNNERFVPIIDYLQVSTSNDMRRALWRNVQ